MADDNYDDSNDSSGTHLSPFLKVLRDAIETEGPEDGIELLRDRGRPAGVAGHRLSRGLRRNAP